MNLPIYSNGILNLKMKVKDVDDVDEIGGRTYFVNAHMFAKIGAARSKRLSVVHNRTFRDRRTHGRTHILSDMLPPFSFVGTV